jgi:amino acid transporter
MLQRRLGMLQAVSMNMAMMVGIGPFITMPAIVGHIGGPHAIFIWFLGALVTICDGLVWSELSSAFPGSGGTYHFYDAVYGASRIGRLLKFLFVWQFLFSGPLELATGAIGIVRHMGYFNPSVRNVAWHWSTFPPGVDSPVTWAQLGAMGIVAAVTMLAYRRIEGAGHFMVVFWVGVMGTVVWLIVAGLSHLKPSLAFDFPPDAWQPTRQHILGVGLAMAPVMYDFLGYYQICYLGDEVVEPERTIPRSILISVVLIALMYLAFNLSIVGVLPYNEVVSSHHVASDMMQRIYGHWAASLVTLLIAWSALAATFAGLLGYSRVPYASARTGHFFRFFEATHPIGLFPHRSLLLVGGLTALACLADLETMISALLASRIIIQFIGQIVTLSLVRARKDYPPSPRSFLMPLYPIPSIIALAGWLFIFGASTRIVVVYAFGSLILGVVAFVIWDRLARRAQVA